MSAAGTDAARRLRSARNHHLAGRLQQAHQAYLAVLRDNPCDADALHFLGLLACQTGHPDQGIPLVRQALSINPDHVQALSTLGQVHAGRKEWAAAAEAFTHLLTVSPDHADTVNNLGNVRKKQGHLEEALALYRRATALAPAASHGWFNLAKLLRDVRAFDDAIAAFRKAVACDGANYRAHYELAICLEEKGDFAEAETQYRAALRIDPGHAKSIANLLALRHFAPDEAFLAHAQAVACFEATPREQRAKLHQGLGKYHDRSGHYDRAFPYFQASNLAQRPPEALRSAAGPGVAALIETFDATYFDRLAPFGSASARPIFVVGMPRSGTTLTEQILASHSDVFGGGESMEIPKRMHDLSARGMLGDGPSIQRAAERYLAHLGSFAPADAARVTDKLPVNYRHLGLIAAMFPRAAIVHCRRDARDVLVSCMIEMLNTAEDDFTTLEGITAAIEAEARLMAHWCTVLPMTIHSVQYEALLAEPETISRALIDACGLEWSDACLRFFDTERHVDTPSRWQVRQPIYQSSKARWRNYARQLEPAIRRLEAAGLIND